MKPVTDEVPARRSYLEGARAVLPLAVAIGAFGVSFGVLSQAAGLSEWAAIAMSATTAAGSAQFAAIGVMAAGGGPGLAVAAGALLNARYAILGVSAAPALAGPAWKRLLLAQLVMDETWAVAHRADGSVDRHRLVGAGVVLYVTHVGSTAIGALGLSGHLDPPTLGLDAAFPALFLALLWPYLRHPRGRWVAALGAGAALSLTPVAPPGLPIVAAAGAALLGWRRP